MTGERGGLNENIKKAFLDTRGPGHMPEITDLQKKNLGLVVPHAGYIYSGAIAAFSYDYLSKNGFGNKLMCFGIGMSGDSVGDYYFEIPKYENIAKPILTHLILITSIEDILQPNPDFYCLK